MKLDSFCEVSLPVGPPRRCRSEKLLTPAPQAVFTACRPLSALLDVSAPLSITPRTSAREVKEVPIQSPHNLQNLGYCIGGLGSRRIGVYGVMPCVASLGRVASSVNMCGEVCRRLHRLKRPCGRVLWKSGRAGPAVRLETEGGRPFNLRSDESTSWRDKSLADICTGAVYSWMRGLRRRRICWNPR